MMSPNASHKWSVGIVCVLSLAFHSPKGRAASAELRQS